MAPIVGAGVGVAAGLEHRRGVVRDARAASPSPGGCRRGVARARERRRASAPTPPTPKVARVHCPSSSTATCAAAATMAKSPWRRLISVKAEPVLRSRHTGHAISVRHSSWATLVVIASFEEVRRRQRPRAGFGAQRHAGFEDLRDQRQLRRWIGMHQAAAGGAAVAGLHMADMRQRLPQQRHACGQRVVALDIALARAGAHAHGIGFGRDEFQRRDLVDVDQPGRAQQPERHHRHQALAAGDDLGVVAVLRQQRAGLLDRGRTGVFKWGRFQTCDL